MCMTCNTPTPGHHSAADEAWNCPKRVLCNGYLSYFKASFAVCSYRSCGSLILSCTCTCYSACVGVHIISCAWFPHCILIVHHQFKFHASTCMYTCKIMCIVHHRVTGTAPTCTCGRVVHAQVPKNIINCI